jgi:Flp pilus assembly protein TadD
MRASPAERVAPSGATVYWALGVAALTFLAFLPTLSNGWVDFDDTVFIIKNARLYSLSAENLSWMFSAAHGGHYHPLTWLSWAINIAVLGAGPAGFHLTDLLLHCANAALFFFIARRLLNGSDMAAAAAALFFSVHPLRVESVAWAIERRDVLSGFFYLATIMLHLKAIEAPGKHWRKLSWLAYALSLLSKGVGLTLPAALILLDLYPLKRKVDWREKIPYAVMAVVAAVLAISAESVNGSALGLTQFPLTQRLATSAFGAAFYMAKTVLPINLRPLYETPQVFNPASPIFLASGAFVIVAAAALAWSRRPAWLAAAGFYAVTILPMLGLLRFGPQLAADRYSYLATMSFALLFGGALNHALNMNAEHRLNAQIAALVIIGGLGAQTFRQTARWHDPVTLWSYALEINPDVAMGQQHLGYALAGRGQYAQAVLHYKKALELRPDYWLAWDNLGWSLAAQGMLDEACGAYEKAIALKPDYWEAHSNLGLALGRRNKLKEAERELTTAVALAPDESGVHNNLGLVYFSEGRKELAVQEFQKTLLLDPRAPQARMMLERLRKPPGR